MEGRQARISFAQFESYSQAYLAHRETKLSRSEDDERLSWLTYAKGWEWQPPTLPGVAFEGSVCLSRSFSIPVSPRTTSPVSEFDIELDPNLLQEEILSEPLEEESTQFHSLTTDRRGELVTITQTISHSKIWQLPILHFHANHSSGEPVPLEQLKELNIVFRTGNLPEEVEGGGFEGAISVTDHPRSGIPVYYLHPCQTNDALNSLLEDRQEGKEEGEGEEEGWKYIASFISLCSSAVEMRAS